MRVENFFLFFGPKIWPRSSAARPSTASPRSRAGGYVKISGMNPDDVLPEGEEHRGYYEMPVWKRIVVIGAGPAVNIVLAFAILFVVCLTSARTATQNVGEIVPRSPAAGAAAGRPDRSRSTAALPDLDQKRRVEGFGKQVNTHECAGGRRTAASPRRPPR